MLNAHGNDSGKREIDGAEEGEWLEPGTWVQGSCCYGLNVSSPKFIF